MNDPSHQSLIADITPSLDDISLFHKIGYHSYPIVIDKNNVDLLIDELNNVLNGNYNLNVPTKMPKLKDVDVYFNSCNKKNEIKSKNKSNNNKSLQTLHMINLSKSNKLYQSLVLNPHIGKAVAKLCGWKGTRFAQDQVWIKPPNSVPLTYHRDSTYFDFEPNGKVCTVWITLDDLSTEESKDLGPLEYCLGSNLWGESRRGSAQQFFDAKYRTLVINAAAAEGLNEEDLIFDTVKLKAGGLSIHHGKTWHGSGPNISTDKPRRGIGIHYIPSDAKWRNEIENPNFKIGKLWAPLKGENSLELNDEHFPIIWHE